MQDADKDCPVDAILEGRLGVRGFCCSETEWDQGSNERVEDAVLQHTDEEVDVEGMVPWLARLAGGGHVISGIGMLVKS